MTLSLKSQKTQAVVLVALQRRMVQGSVSARYVGQLADLSAAQAAAALKLLENKGLVGNHQGYWFLTGEGLYAEVTK
jgi:hypothetical protein